MKFDLKDGEIKVISGYTGVGRSIFKIDADKLRQARTNRGLSQNDLAKIFGVTLNTYANWERGSFNPNEEVRPAVIKFIEEWSE